MFIMLKSKSILAFAQNTFRGKQFTVPAVNLVTILSVNKSHAILKK